MGSLIQLFPGIFCFQTNREEREVPPSRYAEPQMIPCGTAGFQRRGWARERRTKPEVGRAPALPGHAHSDTCSSGSVLARAAPTTWGAERLLRALGRGPVLRGHRGAEKVLKKQLSAPSLFLVALRHTGPSLPRPVGIPNWEHFNNGQGKMPFSWSEWPEPPIKAWKMLLPPARLGFLPCLPPRALPAPSSAPAPTFPVGCSTAPCTSFFLSLHFTCPTLKPLQNSTSAYTSVLICSAPTLGCIPAPFLITLISHTPLHGFSPALLQAHTGPLEPKHVRVPLQSCLIGIFWAENLPCMKNVFFFFFPSMDLLPMGRNLCLFRTLCAFWQ